MKNETKTMTTNKEEKIFRVFKVLTFAFFFLSFMWAVLGVCRSFAIIAAFTLGLLFFMSLGKKKTASKIFTSCLMVADCGFILCAAFLAGRAFMGM